MSATNQAAALPDAETAYNTLFNGIHARVFFSKLASLGHEVKNEKQAQALLELAGKLRVVEQESGYKAAEELNDPYVAANHYIDEALGQHGLDASIKKARAAEEAGSIRQVAQQLSQDPGFYNSVLSLKAAEAAALQAQFEENNKTRLATAAAA